MNPDPLSSKTPIQFNLNNSQIIFGSVDQHNTINSMATYSPLQNKMEMLYYQEDQKKTTLFISEGHPNGCFEHVWQEYLFELDVPRRSYRTSQRIAHKSAMNAPLFLYINGLYLYERQKSVKDVFKVLQPEFIWEHEFKISHVPNHGFDDFGSFVSDYTSDESKEFIDASNADLPGFSQEVIESDLLTEKKEQGLTSLNQLEILNENDSEPKDRTVQLLDAQEIKLNQETRKEIYFNNKEKQIDEKNKERNLCHVKADRIKLHNTINDSGLDRKINKNVQIGKINDRSLQEYTQVFLKKGVGIEKVVIYCDDKNFDSNEKTNVIVKDFQSKQNDKEGSMDFITSNSKK